MPARAPRPRAAAGATRPGAVIAAFEPFEGRVRNRSLDGVRRYARLRRPGVETAVLPTTFAALAAGVPPLVERAAHVLILVGESRGARRCRLERLALNLKDARVADNEGARPVDEPVIPGGPLALAATWPARDLQRALAARDLRADVSPHAGTFVCNAALYVALDHAARLADPPLVGFLHVPAADRWCDDAHIAKVLDTCVKALTVFR